LNSRAAGTPGKACTCREGDFAVSAVKDAATVNDASIGFSGILEAAGRSETRPNCEVMAMRSSRRITFPGAAIGLTCLLLGAASAVWAQTSTDSPLLRSQSMVGGTMSMPQHLIRGSQNTDVLRHRDLNGKPCLDIGGYARPLSSTSKLFDHVIAANNA